MSKIPVRSVLVAVGVLGVAGFASTLYAWFRLQPTTTRAYEEKICETIATDPEPPLKVRSSPVVAPDNVVGNVKNGTVLTVVDTNQGWLRIQSPIPGWVYKERTATSCIPKTALTRTTAAVPTPLGNGDEAAHLMAAANEQYQAGNLKAAIALATSIPPNHVLYPTANEKTGQWQRDWQTAETKFFKAQKALREGKSASVLEEVKDFPDNRYWKERITPLVQSAIKQNQTSPAPQANQAP